MSESPKKLRAHLRLAFSKEECAFLEGHPRFSRLMRECDDSEASVRGLIQTGGGLILEHYEAPSKSVLRRRPRK